MRFYKNVIVFALVVIFAVSCGKKTDPVVLTESIPVPDSNLRIFNNDEGVVIRNSDKKYSYTVQRAEFNADTMVLSDYDKPFKIAPQSTYIDTGVVENVRYVYNIVAEHPVYNNKSAAAKKSIVYGKPIKITDIQIKELAGDRFTFTYTTDAKAERVEVFTDGSLDLRTSRNSFELSMLGKENRTVTIIPYDINGNAGQERLVRLAMKQKKPDAPFGFKNIYANGVLTLSWDEPSSGWLYNVYILKDGTYTFLGKVDMPYFMYNVGKDITDCRKFAVTTVLDGNESEMEEYTACW